MAAVSISFSAVDGRGDGVRRPLSYRDLGNGVREAYGQVTISGTYTSTKVPISASDFSLATLDRVFPFTCYGEGVAGTGTYLTPYYNPSTGSIILTEDGAEVAATFDTDGFVFDVIVRGQKQ